MSETTITAEAPGILDAIGRFSGVTVLVVGDFILDRFVYGTIDRISPEAPIPVLHGRSETTGLGGAGNVVANILALGGKAVPLGVIADDAAGRTMRDLFGRLGVDAAGVSSGAGRVTSCKSRFVALNQQVLRFDEEEIRPLETAEREALVARFAKAVGKADIVVLSDYGKGALLDGAANELIQLARVAGIPVVVDPKGNDYGRYRHANLVTPNRKELGEAAGRQVMDDREIVEAGRALIASHAIGAVLATRSERGMSVVSAGHEKHIATQAREVFDVSGAGDTVVAAVALGLGAGLGLDDAAELANSAAGVVVGKRGTAQVTADELVAALLKGHGVARPAQSVVGFDQAARIVEGWKRDGFKVGFTNGCFDILHVGHVSLLQAARANCDRLVVGLNSDASTSRLKGPSRPVNDEHDRASVLAALSPVDLVVVFGDDTPLMLIERLSPDVLIKGGDYTADTIVGAGYVTGRGGRVVIVDLVAGRSTTNLIRRMAERPPEKASA